jgi:hypothetical protein
MNAVTFRNLDVVAVSLGCSGYGTKRAFLHIHLSDGKIVRFNDWDEKELGMLKDILNGSARVGIKKKRKYYYLQNIIANTPEQTITK